MFLNSSGLRNNFGKLRFREEVLWDGKGNRKLCAFKFPRLSVGLGQSRIVQMQNQLKVNANYSRQAGENCSKAPS